MKKKILSILLMGILVIGLTGCGKVELKNEWAKTYEEYLKKALIDKSETSLIHWQNYQNFNISFINIEEYKYPIMLIKQNNKIKEDEEDSCDYNLIYLYLDENNEIQPNAICNTGVEFKLLYDIQEEKYKYGLYYVNENEEPTSHWATSLTFKDDISENNSFEEFKNKYIDVELNLVEKTIDNKITEKDLLKTVQDLTEKEKINTITEDNKKYVEEKLEETKKAEDEEIKKKEEEASKVINVGNYTLQYGYYKNTNTISAAALDITINSDNTCTYQTDNQEYGTDTCTYEIQEYSGTEFDGSYVSGYHIIFHISGQSDKYFNVTDNNTFIDQSAQLKYVGPEKE